MFLGAMQKTSRVLLVSFPASSTPLFKVLKGGWIDQIFAYVYRIKLP